jgi:hypothetical protein
MEETVNTPGKSMEYDYFTQEMLPKIQASGGINFMGGEPTLHPQFNEIFSNTLDAMSPYSNLGLFTNGLMKDHVLDLLENTVSVQGSIKRHITFAVLLNWQTNPVPGDRRYLSGDRPAQGSIVPHPDQPGVSHRRRNRQRLFTDPRFPQGRTADGRSTQTISANGIPLRLFVPAVLSG